MKHLLKPTGQILTTAVVTSTMMDAYFPLVASPLPLDSSSPETKPTAQPPDMVAIANQSKTVAPPEQESSRPSHSAGDSEWSILPEGFYAETVELAVASTPASQPTTGTIRVLTSHSVSNREMDTDEEINGEQHDITTRIVADIPQSDESFLSMPSIPVLVPSTVHPIQPATPQNHPQTERAIAPSTVERFPAYSDDAAPTPYTLEEFTQPWVNEAFPEPAATPFSHVSSPSDPAISGSLAPDAEMSAIESAATPPSASNSAPLEHLEFSPSPVGPTLSPSNRIDPEPSMPTNPDSGLSGPSLPIDLLHNRVLENAARDTLAEAISQTKDWLDQQLAVIVAQAHDRQAFSTRQRLIDYARESIAIGNLNEARNTATNPILTPAEQEALRVAIAQARPTPASPNGFIPLIPLNEDLDLIAIQTPPTAINVPRPMDELPVLPTTPLSVPDTLPASAGRSAAAPLPEVPLAQSGLHQWPSRNKGGINSTLYELPAPSSATIDAWEQCLNRPMTAEGSDPASLSLNDRYNRWNTQFAGNVQAAGAGAIAPIDYIGTGQQPPSVATTAEHFPTGANFLAGVGQQPPSILSESSWSGPPVLSSDSTPFKWTRDRLYQELAVLTAETSSTDCQTLLASHDSIQEGSDRIGGPTVASLTGYEWLSQFTFPDQSVKPQQTPIHMILPLPYAVPITSKFGWRSHPIHGGRRFHFGIDYGASQGTPILASIPGRVETTGTLDGYGLTVIVENEELGLRTLYAHMSGIAVTKGDVVDQGAVMGWVGSTGNSTGPHLHFEVHKHTDEGWVAMDPLQAAADLINANHP